MMYRFEQWFCSCIPKYRCGSISVHLRQPSVPTKILGSLTDSSFLH